MAQFICKRGQEDDPIYWTTKNLELEILAGDVELGADRYASPARIALLLAEPYIAVQLSALSTQAVECELADRGYIPLEGEKWDDNLRRILQIACEDIYNGKNCS